MKNANVAAGLMILNNGMALRIRMVPIMSREFAITAFDKGEPLGLLTGFGWDQRKKDTKECNNYFKNPELLERFETLPLPPDIKMPLELQACPSIEKSGFNA